MDHPERKCEAEILRFGLLPMAARGVSQRWRLRSVACVASWLIGLLSQVQRPDHAHLIA